MGRPWSFYLASCLRLHNETVNFWSHAVSVLLLGASFAFSYWPGLHPASEPLHWPFILGYAACTAMFAASAAAHLLHSKSARVHELAFMADYAGIGLFGLGTALPHLFYVSTDAFFAAAAPTHLPTMAGLALASCLLGSYFKVKERVRVRRLSQSAAIAAMYLWTMAPALTRYQACIRALDCDLGDPVIKDHAAQVLLSACLSVCVESESC